VIVVGGLSIVEGSPMAVDGSKPDELPLAATEARIEFN